MMRKPLTHISVSSMQHFQDDPLTWCYTWLDNRVPRSSGAAVSTGRFVHKAFEAYFKEGGRVGDHLASILAPIDPRYLTDRAGKAFAGAERLIEPLNLWEDRYPITETLAVEEPFERTLYNGLIFQGRPDRVVVCYDKVWHFQHKTLAASRNPNTFIELSKHSFHELLYADHLRSQFANREYGGSIFNVIRKVKYRSEAKGPKYGTILNDVDKMFMQRHINLDPVEIMRAKYDMDLLAEQMLRTAEAYIGESVPRCTPPRNRHFDSGYYGTGINPYLPVILGDTTLDDDSRYMDRQDQYDHEEEDDDA